MDMQRETNYYMRDCEGLAMLGVSNLAPMWHHQETKTNEAYCIIYITEKAALLLSATSLFRLTDWFQIHLFLF